MPDEAPGETPESIALHHDEVVLALQAREQFLDSILGTLEVFFTVDADWRLTFVNRAAAEMAGVAPGELIGQDMWRRLLPGLHEQTGEELRRAMAERISLQYEVTGRQGSTYQGTAHPLSDGGLAIYVRDVSEVRLRERALRRSERLYRGIVETTGDGIMIGELDGTIAFANQRMADMLGYELDELVGMQGFDFVFPDWRPAVLDNRAALEEGGAVRGEFKLRRKDGSALWTMFSSTRMLDEDGEHVGNLTMHSDISELKAAEEALRRSEERFRLVLSAAPVSVAAMDRDLRYVWAFNQRTSQSSGLMGKADADLFTAEEAARLTAIKRRVLDEGVEIHEQLWLDRPRGRMFLDCTFAPLYDEDGAVSGVGITTFDLTPMRLAEEARRESERTLRTFYDTAPFLMGVGRVVDGHAVVVSGNRAMAEWLRADVDELVEWSGVEYGVTPEFERRLVDAYGESRRTGRPVRFEQEVMRADDDGPSILNFTVAHVGDDADGEPLYSFIAEDVTERRREQRTLRENELAAAAQEERVRLARDLHDSITQALFAASLKAESITGGTESLPDVQERVREVRRLTGGALSQMRALLLELRGEPIHHVPVRQLLQNVVGATESRTRTEVLLEIEGDAAPPADVHVALYRIAQEALNNVARHARAEHAWVSVTLEPGLFRIKVRDDGWGFDPEPLGPSHLGMRSMLERAAETGGEFSLVAAPEAGTEVSVEWRLPDS